MKHHSNLGRKGFIWLRFHISVQEVMTEIQIGKDPGAGAGAEAMEKYREVLLTGLLLPNILLRLLSYRNQNHQPRFGTTHNGPDPPLSITS